MKGESQGTRLVAGDLGGPAEAAASMHDALWIYEEGRAVAPADRTRLALARLASRSGTGPV